MIYLLEIFLRLMNFQMSFVISLGVIGFVPNTFPKGTSATALKLMVYPPKGLRFAAISSIHLFYCFAALRRRMHYPLGL